MIRVSSGAMLTIRDSGENRGVITGGYALNGGGIYNGGTLILEGGSVEAATRGINAPNKPGTGEDDMKDNVKLYRTIMALTLALCMMIVSMSGYAPDAFLTFAEAAEAEDSEAKLEAREATPALATEERSGIFEDAEISRMIDENYQKVLEDGYAELRIPMSLHGITEDALTGNSLEVGRKLLENGFEAYVIGGCMRDFIMGTQSVDIDIVTNASLEQQRELFGDALETHISGGRVFGGVVFPDETVDLATYQNVPASFYGLRGVPDFDPSTEISDSPLLDSFQRDLTINAIYYDMSNGDLVDYHGGIHDIREHVLNTMVNPLNALTEDPRILVRAIRFKARYGFDFSEALDSVIRERGVDLLNAIDRYDLYSNISKMMVAGYSSAAWPVLMDSELLDTVYHNYAFILTRDALEIMGRPRYVSFLTSKKQNRVICLPLKSRRKDLGGCSIPESVYQHNGGYAVWLDHSFLEQMYFFSDVSGESTYAIEVGFMPIEEIKAGQIPGVEKGVKVKGISLVFDMMSAEVATMNECPIYTFGGNRVA